MKYTIDFENDGRGVHIRFDEDIDGQDVYSAIYESYRTDAENRLKYHLTDFSRTHTIESVPEDLRKIVMLDYEVAPLKGKQVIAIVGGDDVLTSRDYVYRIYAAAWLDFEVQTFRSITSAREWVEELTGFTITP